MQTPSTNCLNLGHLAVFGYPPVRVAPPSPWPFYADDEIKVVVDTLISGKVNYWTGPRGKEFEAAFAERFNQPHALAVANGSLALELLLYSHRIGSGDEVIVSPRSFIASASCVNRVGAEPVFADVDADTGLISPETVRERIGTRTKAIIVVHLYGRPADMPGFTRLANQHGVLLFEDCAQAHGGSIDGRLLGGLGHGSAFSFCQDKIITTGGEGGMVLFSDEAAYKRAWSFRDHGKDQETALAQPQSRGFRWLRHSLGSNCRLTEMQSAIGLRQLEKLQDWHEARTANARWLATCLSAYPSVRITPLAPGHKHAYYRFEFTIVPERLKPGWTRDGVLAAVAAEGIPCFSGVCPEIYLEKAYSGWSPNPARLGNAMKLGELSLVLLVHPTLDEQFLKDCSVALRKVFDVVTD